MNRKTMNQQNDTFENRVQDCMAQLQATDFIYRTYLPELRPAAMSWLSRFWGNRFASQRRV